MESLVCGHPYLREYGLWLVHWLVHRSTFVRRRDQDARPGADWKYPEQTEAVYSALSRQFEAFGRIDVEKEPELAG